MNTSSPLRRGLRRLVLIMVLTVAGGAAGATYAAVKTPTYTAKAYLVATASRSDPATALNFAQAYGRIATSGPVLAVAANRLSDTSGLSSVRAATSPDAPVVELVATSDDAQHAADLANAVARGLAEYASKHGTDTTVKLSVLAAATVPDRPTSPKPPWELAIGAAAGLLIGGLIALGGGGGGEPAPEPGHVERSPRAGRAPMPPTAATRTAAIPLFSMPPVEEDATAMTDILRPVAEQPVSPAVGSVPSRAVGRVPVDEPEEEQS
ncbi:Wzz/FepE/Etk N-terminal domain-containing protein [Actinoplanes sp. NPDC020271]|uniref:Wzz/FepE/Etk N-terminal domain-containing protein n=1 Tax=Actinoplanes sp. NPDC020271 TaxID=3363896 RepID=UPI003789A73F